MSRFLRSLAPLGFVLVTGLPITAAGQGAATAAPRTPRAERQRFADAYIRTTTGMSAFLKRIATDDQLTAQIEALADKGDLAKLGDIFAQGMGVSRSLVTVTRAEGAANRDDDGDVEMTAALNDAGGAGGPHVGQTPSSRIAEDGQGEARGTHHVFKDAFQVFKICIFYVCIQVAASID